MELNTFQASRKRSNNCFFVAFLFHLSSTESWFDIFPPKLKREPSRVDLWISSDFHFFLIRLTPPMLVRKLTVRWAQMLIDKLFFIENFVLFQKPMERKEGSETYPNKHNSIFCLLVSRSSRLLSWTWAMKWIIIFGEFLTRMKRVHHLPYLESKAIVEEKE